VPERPQHVEVVLFLVCNGTAAGINFGSRILLSRALPYAVAICVAYACGMVTAFVLSRTVVFRAQRRPVGRQMFWFMVVNGAAVLQTLGVSLLFVCWIFPSAGMTWHAETVAHAIGIGVPVVSSYFGHKHLSFAKR
jgi:putative flippase GtrA